jgi:hypothetical protein
VNAKREAYPAKQWSEIVSTEEGIQIAESEEQYIQLQSFWHTKV